MKSLSVKRLDNSTNLILHNAGEEDLRKFNSQNNSANSAMICSFSLYSGKYKNPTLAIEQTIQSL